MRTTIALILVLVAAAPVQGQQLTLYGGETRYEVGDMGPRTSWLGGVAVGWELNRFLRTDVAFLAFDYEGGSIADGWRVSGTRVATEVGLYVQPHNGWMRPYAGVGAGFSLSRRRLNDDPPRFGRLSDTVHAAAGTDIGMGRSWSLRTELRVRGIVGPGLTSDLTVGFSTLAGK